MIITLVLVYLAGYICFLRFIAEGIDNYPKDWIAYLFSLLWPALTLIGFVGDIYMLIFPDRPE